MGQRKGKNGRIKKDEEVREQERKETWRREETSEKAEEEEEGGGREERREGVGEVSGWLSMASPTLLTPPYPSPSQQCVVPWGKYSRWWRG